VGNEVKAISTVQTKTQAAGLGVLALALGVLGGASAWAAGHSRPDILVILADDMGFSDLGCYGSEIQTPTLDRLATNGLRLTQFYNCARCNPTRAALLTGRYPHQAGMGWGPKLNLPGYLGHLSRESVTIAEVLRAAGYGTYLSGKWHLGDGRGEWPRDRGFDRFFGLVGGAGSYWEVLPAGEHKLALDDQPWKPDPQDKNYYFTDSVTDHAIEFVGHAARSEKPFFLYLAYTAPHWPLHARPDDIARYRGRYRDGWDKLRAARHARQIEMGIVDRSWSLPSRENGVPAWEKLTAAEQDAADLKMAVYAAMIDRMDQGIGRVIAKLRDAGRFDNTLIFFLSDNGGCSVDPRRDTAGSDPNVPPGPARGFWGYGPPWANASNTPFRKFKQAIHEGGIATPLICHWPRGITRAGRIDTQPGHVMDIMATVLDVSGASYPATFAGHAIKPKEGLSFAAVLRGERRPEHPYLFWEHTGNQGVRAGNWKLVATRNAQAGWELYDLATDRTETRDRAAEFPEKVRDLGARYERWAREVGVIPFDEARKRRSER
jgi:arylsulfatase